jgi:hypothetical protein
VKKEATIEDVMLAFLRELYTEKLRHPNPLESMPPDKIWDTAMAKLEEERTVSAETGKQAMNRLISGRCLSRRNKQDGTHILQISAEGEAEMQAREALIMQRNREPAEQRWKRIPVYIAAGALVVGLIGLALKIWLE